MILQLCQYTHLTPIPNLRLVEAETNEVFKRIDYSRMVNDETVSEIVNELKGENPVEDIRIKEDLAKIISDIYQSKNWSI